MKNLARRTSVIQRPLYRALRDYAAQLGYSDLIYLNVGEPDFSTPLHIVEAARKAIAEGFTHYTEEKGIPELRRAVAGDLRNPKGLEIDPNTQILITAGSSEANATAFMSVVEEGDEAILPDPCYTPYIGGVSAAGGKPVFLPLSEEDWTWDLEALKRAITPKTKVVVVNSPSNPTGGVFDSKMLKGIADLARDYGFYILADEVYDAFIYNGEKLAPSIATLDPTLERTIITNSFSKTYAMTGWRVGYLAGSEELVTAAVKVRGVFNVCASSISQKAALAALEGPKDCVRDMLREYSERRNYLVKALEEIPGLSSSTPQGAFYIFPRVGVGELNSLEFSKYLIKEAHVVVSPGAAFGPSGEGHLRLSYASSMQNLKEAVKRLKAVFEKVR